MSKIVIIILGFLVCDPQAGIDWYKLDLGNQVYEVVPAQRDTILRYEITTVKPGRVKAGRNCNGPGDPLKECRAAEILWSPWGYLTGDFDRDGDIDSSDLSAFNKNFGYTGNISEE
jgi:hypothetical protein